LVQTVEDGSKPDLVFASEESPVVPKKGNCVVEKMRRGWKGCLEDAGRIGLLRCW
jgi:hypothetical protein